MTEYSLYGLLGLIQQVHAARQGMDGFLGSRGSIMLDVVFLAMFVVVPVLCLSLFLVKSRGLHRVHKRIQLTLGIVLLLAVAAFEIDMQLFTDWRQRAVDSPYYNSQGWSAVMTSLVIHLSFAIPTLVLWIVVIVQALRKFSSPPLPNSHSQQHKKIGWLAALGMIGTAATGWFFYWMAFMAV